MFTRSTVTAQVSPAGAQRRRTVRQIQPRRTPWRWAGWTGRTGGRRRRALRRALAVVLILLAGVSAGWQRSADSGVAVATVVRDLALGATVSATDVVLLPLLQPPEGALTSLDAVVGHTLSGAVRRGEVLTDLRLVDDSGPDPGPGRAALTVRPADPAVTQLLVPGMGVTVVGLTSEGTAQVLSAEAVVLAVLSDADDRSRSGRPVLLSIPSGEADVVSAGVLAGDIALRLN